MAANSRLSTKMESMQSEASALNDDDERPINANIPDSGQPAPRLTDTRSRKSSRFSDFVSQFHLSLGTGAESPHRPPTIQEAPPSPRLHRMGSLYSVESDGENASDEEEESVHQPLDYDRLTTFLQYRNPVMKLIAEKQPQVLTLHIFENGNSVYKHLSIRDLFLRVRKIAFKLENKNSKSFVPPTLPGVIPDSSDGSAALAGQLQYRDLRRLEYEFTPQEDPTVLVRRHAVLVSLDPLRAVILADRLILIVPDGADNLIELLTKQMQAWVSEARPSEHQASPNTDVVDTDKPLPFEMRAYEAVLGTAYEVQKLEYRSMVPKISKVLHQFKQSAIVSIPAQENMRQLKNAINSMLERTQNHKQVFDELLEEDEDMALMNLTLLKKKPHLYNTPLVTEIMSAHEDIEVLLESFLMDYNSLQSKLKLIRSQLQSAEELVMLRLDTARNQLLSANISISVVACVLAFGSFVGSIWGMNLKNKVENRHGVFLMITLLTTGVMIVAAAVLIWYMRAKEIIPR